MKKILFLLLISAACYGQADFPEGIRLGGNTATAESSKIVSQQPGTGELNYINATALPISTAVQGSLDAKENLANKQNSLTPDGTGAKYPTVDAVNAGFGVAQKDVVYVDVNGSDATGALGNIRKPFLSINAALDALPATGGVVRIGLGTFNSPLLSKVKSNTYFIGSGKPTTNLVTTYTTAGAQPTITAPTKLVGGTILNGKFDLSLRDNIGVFNLGVDVGSDWCTASNGGVADEGLIFAQRYTPGGGESGSDGVHPLQSDSRPRTGIIVNNVISLCKAANSPVHAMLIENTLNASISNVSTYFGGAGLVVKSIGCNVVNFDGHGHNSALIVKSNDYAYGRNNNFSNIHISPIVGYDTGGVILVGATGETVFGTNFSNVYIEHTIKAFENDGPAEIINIDGATIYDTQYVSIDFNSSVSGLKMSNIEQRNGMFGMSIVGSSNVTLSNITTGGNEFYGFYFDVPVTNINCINLVSNNNPNGVYLVGNVYGTITDSANNFTGVLSSVNLTTSGKLSAIDTKGKVTISNIWTDSSGNILTNGGVAIGTPDLIGKFNLKEGATRLEMNTGAEDVSMLAIDRVAFGFKDFKFRTRDFIIAPEDTEKFRFSLDGRFKIATTPTTSASTYDFLTRNTSTGVVEKVSSNTIATIASPAFTGTPTAPTATVGTNTTQIATTAFVLENGATSGKYTPTATPVSNISAISYIAPHTYTRVGNIVTVYGASTPTTSSPVSSSYTITLPIPRATAKSRGIGFGRGASEGSNELSPLIVNSSSTTTATISFYNTVVGGIPCRYSFQYDVTD